jgi:membrane protease YdiL (CAAX protease family)
MSRNLYLKLILGFLAYSLAVLGPIYLFPPEANATHPIPIILLLFGLAVAAVVIPEMLLFKSSLLEALRNTGIGRPRAGVILVGLLVSLPLLVYFPIFSLITRVPLILFEDWPYRLLTVVLMQGLTEEMMFRGYLFGHLRAGRSFRRAAAISALFFGLAHLHLFTILDPLVAGIATLLAVVSHVPLAYLYERGRNTIWTGSIVHIAATGLGGNLFVIPPEVFTTALSLFLLVTMISPYLAFLFFRQERGYPPSTLNVQEIKR